MLFFLWADESRYGYIFQYLRKAYFLGRDEYSEIINGAYELLLFTSSQLVVSILSGGRQHFRNERGCGGRTSVMFTQTRCVRG